MKPKFSISELYQELDRCRPSCAPEFTEEQWKLIEHAREGDSPVPWMRIVSFLKQHYNIDIKLSTLCNRYSTRENK